MVTVDQRTTADFLYQMVTVDQSTTADFLYQMVTVEHIITADFLYQMVTVLIMTLELCSCFLYQIINADLFFKWSRM